MKKLIIVLQIYLKIRQIYIFAESARNQQLTDGLQIPIIRRFKRHIVYSFFKDNIWGIDLADMQLISKYNKGIRLCHVSLIF